ncbi:MAG: FAD-dependent oxidoreductase, partial [Candidatus Cloacimonetes bacterium]|nr:FAD-dependent oxidoreductase [Candidatus Cloacimonadota bacterium]
NMEVTAISRKSGSYIVDFSNGEKFQSNVVINCAGLFCENVARLAGIATAKSNLRIHWCKGEYYKTTRIKGIKHLIYPVPDPRGISLGIHLSINLNGEVRFGPNAYYIDEINYRMDESYKKEFLEAVNRYIGIAGDDLNPDDCGIRAKLQGANEGFRDFYIRDEAEKGLPGFINLMGIESPGLTCSLAIAEYITSLVRQI